MLPLLILLLASNAAAQVCRISVSGVNRERRVAGPVTAECPFSLHTPPFGNWGVTSNFGSKLNGHQFQGWCHDTSVCDNAGNCRTACRDGWYEWNSCTTNALYRPPNCTLYNADNCTSQVSATDINVHGTRVIDMPVRCPSEGGGGCSDISNFSNGSNFMSLYELDPGTADELVQTIYFPDTLVDLVCDQWGCAPAASQWVAPMFYDSPTTPARVYAEMAMIVNSAVFIDTSRACSAGPSAPAIVNAASYRAPIAPDSIASAFGSGVAPGTSGATVSVADANGVTRSAPVYYISPSQINFLIPAATALGPATVRITRSDNLVATSGVLVERVAPGLFGDAQGQAAVVAVRLNNDGTQTVLPAGAPIDPSNGRVYLMLFGTGIRRHNGLETVRVVIGGRNAEVLYAGPQYEYSGLDQVNVFVPASLAGRGEVGIQLVIENLLSNVVTILIQ